MTERGKVVFGNTKIEYIINRSKRRKKTVAIVLDRAEGVLVAAPAKLSKEQIRQVVLKRADWIVRKASEDVLHPRRKEFVSGESLLYLGREVRLFAELDGARRPSLRFDHWSFHLTLPAGLDGEKRREVAAAAVVGWYKDRASERLSQRVAHWAGVAGYAPNRVLVRDQRQRWGSCGPDGTLRFNWRIIMAPPSLIDYVVVHEMAHLRVRNHSPAFWAEVHRMMPDYKMRRSLLKELGPRLTI
ncbi:MAG: M48 family metallopeptidase [Chloroflexota bacterium]